MVSPFPGMNPYLENSDLWPEVHSRLIVAISDAISPQVLPKYRVAIEKRVYQINEASLSVGIPDVLVISSKSDSTDTNLNVAVAEPLNKPINVNIPIPEEVMEGYLEVREVGTGEVITVIELLSPKNKLSKEGRNAYENKRQKILGSATHLVEIDLLRTGKPMPISGKDIPSSYRILVSRSNYRPKAELYPFELQEAIPKFPLPLRTGDNEPLLDLQLLINQIYDRAGFYLAIDYTSDPAPKLSKTDTVWAANLLQQQGLR
ncbi:hypothetical protein DSM106972_023270 [Dulcicalothrix desertica PCC 7102]|uniref:DUF4058 domain-containing protein n=1 Tax=Dulcicalothrix desertica PCC 7102 TaxID=232991 RepID=A0A3S1CPX9_9CYAN|nr:DUF4058 family protein [Dulcicalothrix desertica]RUT07066.1 hypothetical protein DSM106972_023270 [Dulcicalothrix desertica PCC 7102]TWH61936.1 uncharacterized protein DUF4058 [Dulcicalothrix desertica PCC 7102]